MDTYGGGLDESISSMSNNDRGASRRRWATLSRSILLGACIGIEKSSAGEFFRGTSTDDESSRPTADLSGRRSLIMGGAAISDLNKHPWFAAAKMSSSGNVSHGDAYGTFQHANELWKGCGASLIAPRYVLTAAHCLWDPTQDLWQVLLNNEDRRALDPKAIGLEYRIGFSGFCTEDIIFSRDDAVPKSRSHAGQNCGVFYEDVPVKEIYLHAKTEEGSDIDLALVELEYQSTAQPVFLDTRGEIFDSMSSSMSIIGGGKSNDEWGIASLPKRLQVVKVSNPGIRHCIDTLEIRNPNKSDQARSMICSSNLKMSGEGEEKEILGTPCVGDSGGPLFVERNGKDILLGVISIGTKDCDGRATAHTKVWYAIEWMCDIMCHDAKISFWKTDCPDWCADR